MKWDFPNNKMFCTMKKGEKFCKIPQGDGKYKWPTLSELYQKCFYPGYTMKIFPDATSKNNLHSANIDAAMAAQCFFKMKDLGLFKENDTKTTVNSLSPGQIDDNFENLHEILETDLSDNGHWTYYKIKHKGLDVTRVVRDDGFVPIGTLSNSVKAQFKKWDEQWAKICHKTASQAAKEANLNIAEERTQEAKEIHKQIEDLLVYALGIDNTINWESLKDTKEFKVPNPKFIMEERLSVIAPPAPPNFRALPKEPDKGLYEPQFSLVDNILNSLKEKKIREAETLYQEAMTAWTKLVDATNSLNANLKELHEQKIIEYEDQKRVVNERFDALEKDWEKVKKTYNDNQKANNDKFEKLKENYFQKNTEAVIQYCEMVLKNSQYPETFPRDFDLDYNSDSKLLIVEYFLPAPDDLPTLKDVKYIAAKKELKESFLSETQLSKIYDSAIYKITLRTLHELFKAGKAEALEVIVFNGWVNAIDKATGKKVRNCIVTIKAKKIEYNEIELSNVDAATCFKYFKGVGSSKLSSITAVKPIAQINKNNKR